MDQIIRVTAINVILADFCLSRLRRIPTPTLHALFRSAGRTNLEVCRSDVCLVSSIRDGMNLVACEYAATQKDKHGILLLSEFTGAVEHLQGSLLRDPWDVSGMVGAIHDALTMDEQRRARNHKKSHEFVMRNTRYIFPF